MIVITDPVSGNRYMLNPQNKTAHQMPMHLPSRLTARVKGSGEIEERDMRAPTSPLSPWAPKPSSDCKLRARA